MHFVLFQYGIAEYEGTHEFLSLVARSMGRLKKGGIPDQTVAARIILNDWNCGKIKYFTHPPEEETSQKQAGADNESMVAAEIVSEFAKEFSIDDFDMTKMESDDMDNLPHILPSQTMLVVSTGIIEGTENITEPSDEENMSDEEETEAEGKENLLSSRISIGAKTITNIKQV